MMRPQPNGAFAWTQEPWGSALRCLPLGRIADHLFTARDLPLGEGADDEQRGWAAVAGALGLSPSGLVRVRQVHGSGVHVRRRSLPARREPPSGSPEADVLVTDDPQWALSVRVADCVPILAADARSGVVAAAHAGWRGTAAGVALAMVRALQGTCAVRPDALVVAVGPSIGPCCYEVGEDVVEAFERAGHLGGALRAWFSPPGVGRRRLDLWKATCDQLEAAGVASRNIHVAGLCTVTHRETFCSYRAHGAGAGRMAAAIRTRLAS